jgi:hypothetical protein
MSETITQNDQASLTRHTGMHFDAYESGEDRSGSQHRNKLQTWWDMNMNLHVDLYETF